MIYVIMRKTTRNCLPEVRGYVEKDKAELVMKFLQKANPDCEFWIEDIIL